MSEQSTAARELDLAKAAGANAHRVVVTWRELQPTQQSSLPTRTSPAEPSSRVEKIDEFYAAALDRGITPILITYWAPRWATRYAHCGLLDFECQSIANSAHKLVPEPAFLDEYADFVAAVKARWPQSIIESWNEPDLYWGDPNYTGRRAFPATPEQFKAIQCAAYAGSKRISDDPVLSAGWAWTRGSEYIRRVHAAGGAACWDLASLHAYPGKELQLGAGTSIARLFARFREIRQQHQDTDPIVVTEGGYTTTGPLRVDQSQQADGSRRLYNRLVTMPDVTGVIFHTLRDAPLPYAPYNQSSNGNYGYGFLRQDWSPKPVYCYFSSQAGTLAPGC